MVMRSAELGPYSDSDGKAKQQLHGYITDLSPRQRERPTTRDLQLSDNNIGVEAQMGIRHHDRLSD
jgi:hypothetical protein